MTAADRLEALRRPIRKAACRLARWESAAACGVVADDLEQTGLLAVWEEINCGKDDVFLLQVARYAMYAACRRPDRRMVYADTLEKTAGALDHEHSRSEAALSLTWMERAYRRHAKKRTGRGRIPITRHKLHRELYKRFLAEEVDSRAEFAHFEHRRYGVSERTTYDAVRAICRICTG